MTKLTHGPQDRTIGTVETVGARLMFKLDAAYEPTVRRLVENIQVKGKFTAVQLVPGEGLVLTGVGPEFLYAVQEELYTKLGIKWSLKKAGF